MHKEQGHESRQIQVQCLADTSRVPLDQGLTSQGLREG